MENNQFDQAKAKKPIFKRWWFWAIIGIIFVGIIAASSNKNDASPSEGPNVLTNEANKDKPKVSAEFKAALKKGEVYAKEMHFSKQRIYDQLTSEYGEKFPVAAARYAIDNLNVDWKDNALKTAKNYRDNMDMSKSSIYDQLVSEHGEKFTKEEAQYAIDHLDE